MKRCLLFFAILFTVQSVQALTYRAVANKDWNDPNAWDLSGVPNENDIAIIDGHLITIPAGIIANISILRIEKASATIGQSMLEVKGTLNVTNSLQLRSEYFEAPAISNKVILKLDDGDINVAGNLVMFREISDKNTLGMMIDATGSSIMNVAGNAFFTFKNSDGLATAHSLSFKLQSELIVAGDITTVVEHKNTFVATFLNNASFDIRGDYKVTAIDEGFSRIDYLSDERSYIENNLEFIGQGVALDTLTESDINVLDGHLFVGENILLKSDHPSKYTKLNLTGSVDTLTVGKNIIMSAISDQAVSLNMHHDGQLNISGNIQRPNNYGGLYMHENTSIIFDSESGELKLPATNLPNSGMDHFIINNMQINNTSGSPMILEGPMSVNNEFQLGTGIVKTDSTNILIIEEGGSITGGSPTSYIDGPVEKRGESDENTFFPLGNNGIYGPIEITPNTNPNAIYRAQFLGDPPPIGGVLSPPLTSLSNYVWEVNRNEDSDPVDVELNWFDGQAAGIGDIDSLSVAYFSPATNTWDNMGLSSVTGESGIGQAGSIISSIAGDPPPIGGIFVTVGTVSTNSVLPVELISFRANIRANSVLLKWETASAYNFSHFEIEHSLDGINFIQIGDVKSTGRPNLGQYYEYKHINPKSGQNYYRLREVDSDHSFTYSHIEAVSYAFQGAIVAAPNPAQNQVRIMGLDPETGNGLVEAYDHAGRAIYRSPLNFEGGTVALELEQLNINSPGTYFLRVTDQQGVHNLTIMKSK